MYKDILVGLGYYFSTYTEDGVDEEKIEILVGQRLLRMDKDALKFIRGKYGSHVYSFIRKNLDEYLALQSKEMFNLEEAMEVVGWEFDDNKKIALLNFTHESISVVGKDYSDAVMAYILKNNYDSEDIKNLCAEYSHYGDKTKKEIVKLVEGQIDGILDDKLMLDDVLLSTLFISDNVSEDDKIRLFSNALPVLNEETCMKHFGELGVSELDGIFAKTGGRRKYRIGGMTTGILDALQAHGWIYAYRVDKDNSERYVIIKNPPKKIID